MNDDTLTGQDMEKDKDTDTYIVDKDIEDLLGPRCGFRVSLDFKERLMAEARSIPGRHRRRRVTLAASTAAAAAIASVVLLTVLHHRHTDIAGDAKQTTASVKIPALPSSVSTEEDSIKEKATTVLLADMPLAEAEYHSPKTESVPSRKTVVARTPDEEKSAASGSGPVTEGELPKVSKETSLDPDKVRLRLLETRRNEGIAYIDRMRDEIEANQAYIEQLMADQNVY